LTDAVMSSGSVSHWIAQLRQGDDRAAQALWERYFRRLVGLARQKLHSGRRRAADEEDAALSAFDSFCRGVRLGRFPRLADRDDLWGLLVLITARKAMDQAQHEQRQKRGGGRVSGESGLGPLEQVATPEPDPAFAAELAEEYRRLLDLLGDDQLRTIAIRKMEGWTNAEIAAELGCADATIERRLRLIRDLWEDRQGHRTPPRKT
jgi:DNA-directed RNA polymerase specialized sigma24 family protein